MKKNGFTLVELITTFALTAVIIILLLNVVNVIRNIYSKTYMKTELYINQGNLSNALNSKITDDNVDSYEDCTDSEFCYIFNFVDGESVKLIVKENQISFGTFTYKLNDKTKIENPTLTKEYVSSDDTSYNNFLVIKIPIICELYSDMDFGINLIYPYDSNIVDL